MKKVVLLIILIYLFLNIFFKSNTWETTQEYKTKDGVEYLVSRQRINWNNFLNYFKELPNHFKSNFNR